MPSFHNFGTIVLIGLGAMAVMDVWLFALSRLGIPTTSFTMVGRWVGHFARGEFAHSSIAKAPPVPYELALGWLTHYVIGIAYAALFVYALGTHWLGEPTFLPALAFGIVTVAAPWFVMQPAMGWGFLAAKTPAPLTNCLRNLANHAVFGTGLYLAATVLAGITGWTAIHVMLAHVPTWVFGVFALLLAIGILFSRPRAVHPVVPFLMAAGFGAYSLYGVISSFGATPAYILLWAAGLFASAFLGKPYFGPRGITRVHGTSKVHVPGNWLPLALMMGIFLVKFVVGVVRGAHLPVGAEAWFAPGVCLVLGLLSGAFTARALTVRRYAQTTAVSAKPLATNP